MKALSPQASDLLARLVPIDDAVPVLTALAGLAEPALVPHLVQHVFDGPAPARRAAAMAVGRALAAATAADVLQLDDACRRSGWAVPWESAWRSLTAARLGDLEALGGAAHAALVVASFHANGWVREAAVARLDRWPAAAGDRVLDVLLVRVNDWVQPVADRARAAVERRVTSAHAVAWVRALPLLRRLGTTTRRDASALTERVLALLRAPEQRDTLVTALASGDRATRRAALSLMRECEWAADRPAEIVTGALRDIDPLVRLHAATFARERLSASQLEAVLPLALADPHAPVRLRILEAAAERLGPDAAPWMERALLDRGAAVRDLARFALRRLGWPDAFATYYRTALRPDGSARSLVAAVGGLAETGDAGDVAALVDLLDHPRPAVRAAVVRAIGRLEAAHTVAARLERLADPSPRVTHAARESLRAQVAALGSSALWQSVRDLPHRHGRLDALALASDLPKWESITLLLDATSAADPGVRAAAGERIAKWLERQNQSFSSPRPHQLDALGRALALHGGNLSASARATLEQLLVYWTPR